MNTAAGYLGVWLFQGCESCYSHLSGNQELDSNRKRPRKDEAWQWEVSDRIFGAKAERLGANWVLWSPNRGLIGPPLAGSCLSQASKTTFSRGCTAQFKAGCCQLCECMNIHMHILAVLCLSFLFIPKFDTLEMHTKCLIHLDFSLSTVGGSYDINLQWFKKTTACTSLNLLWIFLFFTNPHIY